MKEEIKEILDNIEYVADIHKVHIKDGYKVAEKIPSSMIKELRLNSYSAKILYDCITNLQEENERLLKTQKMYEKKCNKVHNYILQNCEIIRHKDYDEVGKVNGRHILTLLAGGDDNE